MDKKRSFGGVGVGYVSLIMIFAVICLAVLAVLSYRAAGANDTLNEKSITYTKQYYAADSRVQEKLMQLDLAAYDAAASMFFEDSFEAACADIDGVTLRRGMDGYTAEFSEPINDRLRLDVSVTVYTMPRDGRRYCVVSRKTVSADTTEDEKPLNVWDGTTIN